MFVKLIIHTKRSDIVLHDNVEDRLIDGKHDKELASYLEKKYKAFKAIDIDVFSEENATLLRKG